MLLKHLQEICFPYNYLLVSNNVGQNIAQNIKRRFFPKEVRTFIPPKTDNAAVPTFVPNALENLSKPSLRKEFENINYGDSVDDFIFEF